MPIHIDKKSLENRFLFTQKAVFIPYNTAFYFIYKSYPDDNIFRYFSL